ncbi:MAG: quinolinate synthase NadA, partial [Selenomonadaceae bacterium]|nr:quinolinate synthase NadA [Selenomonadaceae bacterium]
EIKELKKRREAIILAHNYTVGEVQDIADFTGDSLELSRKAAEPPNTRKTLSFYWYTIGNFF